MPKISICVPYHTSGKTAYFLSRLFTSLDSQTFKDYEIILTKEGKMAENTNAAIRKSKGEIVKILYSDDYFAHPKALERIVEAFGPTDTWMATGCLHAHIGETPHTAHLPVWTETIHTGNNGLGSPSVVAFRKADVLYFDENLSYLLDCDLYRRLYDAYGPPKILDDLNVVIGLHEGQVSNLMPEQEKLQEFMYMKQKYG